MSLSAIFNVMPIYAGLLGIMFAVITLRIGAYRFRNRISLGDGGDSSFQKLIRGQGNFTETVPLALVLLLLMEACGASDAWLHSLGFALVIGRISHYLQLTGALKPLFFRMGGMMATLFSGLIASVWLLLHTL